MAQEQGRIPYDMRVGSFACFIEMRNADGNFTGTGFLYRTTEAPDGTDTNSPHWTKLTGTYIVTNRHVIFGLSEDEKTPLEVQINIRRKERNSDTTSWQTIHLTTSEISKLIYVHTNPDVDIAVIDLLKSGRFPELPSGTSLTNEDFIHNNDMINVECADDVIVVGFPEGFYDETNHFPIVKKGIIASSWGADFEGDPCFLIDAKLFPGSSGSAVLTKPVESILKDGKVYHNKSGKHGALLGVFSAEPYIGSEDSPEFVDVGIVWYAYNIDEVIVGKKIWNENDCPTVSIGSMIRPLWRKK